MSVTHKFDKGLLCGKDFLKSAEDDDYSTFNDNHVNCKECIKLMNKPRRLFQALISGDVAIGDNGLKKGGLI